MSGPQKAGIFIYGKNIDNLSNFYLQILSEASKVYSTDEMAVLNISNTQLVIHKFPAEIENDIEITDPPNVRTSAVKPFFTVASIETAKVKAKEFGGGVFAEVYQGPGFNVSNAHDTEGNVFQIREFKP